MRHNEIKVVEKGLKVTEETEYIGQVQIMRRSIWGFDMQQELGCSMKWFLKAKQLQFQMLYTIEKIISVRLPD